MRETSVLERLREYACRAPSSLARSGHLASAAGMDHRDAVRARAGGMSGGAVGR